MNIHLAVFGRGINLALRVHRRRLVALMYCGYAAMIAIWASQYAPELAACCLGGGVAVQLLLLSLVGLSSEAGDERERRRWDQVYARAYRCLGFVLLIALGTSQVHAMADATTYPMLHAVFQRLPYALSMAAGVVYLTLPQAILLWTEPDFEEAR
jgi:hypothetical protein